MRKPGSTFVTGDRLRALLPDLHSTGDLSCRQFTCGVEFKGSNLTSETSADVPMAQLSGACGRCLCQCLIFSALLGGCPRIGIVVPGNT